MGRLSPSFPFPNTSPQRSWSLLRVLWGAEHDVLFLSSFQKIDIEGLLCAKHNGTKHWEREGGKVRSPEGACWLG